MYVQLSWTTIRCLAGNQWNVKASSPVFARVLHPTCAPRNRFYVKAIFAIFARYGVCLSHCSGSERKNLTKMVAFTWEKVLELKDGPIALPFFGSAPYWRAQTRPCNPKRLCGPQASAVRRVRNALIQPEFWILQRSKTLNITCCLGVLWKRLWMKSRHVFMKFHLHCSRRGYSHAIWG